MLVRNNGKRRSEMSENVGKCWINVGQNDDKTSVRNVGKYWKMSVRSVGKCWSKMMVNVGQICQKMSVRKCW